MIVIDVREPNEYVRKHVEGAINIPPQEIMDGSPQLIGVPKDLELMLYCVSGARSNMAINFLRAQGFSNLTNGINKDQVAAHYGLRLV